MKESPAEAEIVSHKLLLRAGLVRKLTGGLYTFLPAGLRVLKKVEQIVREEMDRAGALEVLMPALQPPDIWEKSGRLESAQDVLFHVKDRSKKDWVLGPTHEEVITTLVAGELNSYKQLPVNFYQIQTKFRYEIRPRFGLMRAKEFIMKDAYSFDIEDESSNASYKRMYDAYGRIFARCGLRAFPVEADTGVMGGAHSHEFMVPAETGENEVVYSKSGDYAANIEKATSQGPLKITPQESCSAAEKFETPNVKTIDDLTTRFDVLPEQQIKTLVYIADGKFVLLLLRGDDLLEEAKLGSFLKCALFRAATDIEIYELLGAYPGSLGAVDINKDIRILADNVLKGASGMVTGANDDGFHLKNVDIKRDIHIDDWCDLRKGRSAGSRSGSTAIVLAHQLHVLRAAAARQKRGSSSDSYPGLDGRRLRHTVSGPAALAARRAPVRPLRGARSRHGRDPGQCRVGSVGRQFPAVALRARALASLAGGADEACRGAERAGRAASCGWSALRTLSCAEAARA